jgi:hypothetical protein
MNAIFPALAMLCIALVVVAGCTTPISPPSAQGTTPPTSVPSGQGLVPGPTDAVPLPQQVAVQIFKNTISTDPSISVTFAGGGGQSYVVSMTATVIRSDGGIETKTALSPQINTNLVLSGTTRTDRAIVDITYTDGKSYRVKDELVPFKNINP